MKIYKDPIAEGLALAANEIDIMDVPLMPEQVKELQENPDIVLKSYEDLGMAELDLNNQMWPTSDVSFRQAVAHLIDKNWIETDILKGFGIRIDNPVPSVLGGWSNPNIKKYPYDPDAAKALLDKAGFTLGSDGRRIDPKTGKTLKPVIFYIRADDPQRTAIGERIRKEMEQIGIPVDARFAEQAVCGEAVLKKYEYNMYTGGLLVTKDPYYLFLYYFSGRDIYPEPYGSNYQRIHNDELDKATLKILSGSTLDEVRAAVFKAQEIIAENAHVIPLYQRVPVKAYRKGWEGVVNGGGEGVNTWITFLNAHREERKYGGEIRYGLSSDIENLNVLTAEWASDFEVLFRIYDSLLVRNPVNLAEDVPWLASSWTLDPWTSPSGVPGLKITFNLVDNATWHDGVKFTSADVKFCIEYYQQGGRWADYVSNVEKVDTPSNTVTITYLNTTSYFALHWLGYMPMLPKHIWEKVALSDWKTYDPLREGTLVGTGPFKFVERKAGEYVLLKANSEYFRRAPGKTLTIQEASLPTLTAGEAQELSVTLVDYTEAPITSGTVTANVLDAEGKQVTEINLSHKGEGVYTASLAIEKPGEYVVRIKASYTSAAGTFTTLKEFPLTVKEAFPLTTTIVAIVTVIIVIVLVAYLLLRRRRSKKA
jgi:peptide/nickel transport system substrate-binding protein